MTDNYIRIASERQAQLDAAKAAFFAQGKTIEEVDGFITASIRKRSEWVDPEAVLKRKKPALTRVDRKMLKAMANELEAGK